MSINFTLSEDQQMIKESANEFAMQVIRPAATHHDQTGEYPWEVLTEAWENGLMNTHVEDAYGGSNMSCMDGMIIAEEMAYGCSGIGTAMEANGLAQQPVILGASDFLKQKYIAPQANELKDGRPIMCAYAVTEPGAGSDVAAMKTVEEKMLQKS